MKYTRCFSLIFSAVLLCNAAFSSDVQKRLDFNRPQTFDAQHYVIRVSFDRLNKKISGETTVTIKPLQDGFRVIDLDAVELSFDSVTLEPSGSMLAFKTLPGKVTVTLDRAYSTLDLITIRLRYSAKPKKGIYFVDAIEGRGAQIWTQGEADENRHWFPSFDFPGDKATSEQYITAEKGETVVGNGHLLERVEEGNGKETWHYKMPLPHATYLVSFVIGKYSKVEDKYGDIPLAYYIYPGREQTARNAYGRTPEMIATFEQLTGIKFPYNKYDQTIVANFHFGGMENITATTMSDTEILLAETDFGKSLVLDLVSHELAHSWFGNLVTCKNWAELWLNEGFATFMEAAFRENINGRDDYLNKIRSDAAQFMIDDTITRRRHGLFNLRAGDVAALFDNASVTYNKGGAVVHMLREQVGNEAFWRAINTYLKRHKLGSVESADLKRAMEEASGQDLSWFFDQWVYATGYPKLDVRQTYSTRSKTLKLTVLQTQKVDPLIPSVFRLPMEVEIITPNGKRMEKIDVAKRFQTFSFQLDGKPRSVKLDPEEKIIAKNVKERTLLTAQ